MDHCRKYLVRRHPLLRYASVLCAVAMLNVLPGCVTTKIAPEMAWVRTDGRRIADDPALLQQARLTSPFATPILTLDRRMKRRAPACRREATLWFRRIKRKTCVRRMLPPLSVRVRQADDAAR